MYESPITIAKRQVQTQLEEGVMKAVLDCGIIVDKEELIKALKYDRDQYQKGYEDGMLVSNDEWISVKERLPDVDYYDYVLAWDGYNINFLHYSHRWQQWEDYCSMKKHHWNVTHWMPLPMPPKGDEGK